MSEYVFQDEEGNPLSPGVLVSIATIEEPITSIGSAFIGVGGVVDLTLSASSPSGTYVVTFVGRQAPVTTATLSAANYNPPYVTVPGLSPTMGVMGYIASQENVYPDQRGSDAALAPGGVTYALFASEAAARAAIDTQTQFAAAVQRLQTSAGLLIGAASAVDLWAADFLGSTFPRAPNESETGYITRVFARLSTPMTTIAALQLMVDYYLTAFTMAAGLTGPVGLDTLGGFDLSGGLDASENTSATLPPITVFDAQTNPTLAAAVGIAPPQFCLLFGNPIPSTLPAWYMGDPALSFLGVNTFLGKTPAYSVIPAPSAQLDALIRSVKAGGTQPVYAISSSS